jgi:hypothetical protein
MVFSSVASATCTFRFLVVYSAQFPEEGADSFTGGLTTRSKQCGCSSVVERLLAKEKVVGSNPIARSENSGGERLRRCCPGRRRQGVRQGSAKPLSWVRIPPSPSRFRYNCYDGQRRVGCPSARVHFAGRWRNGRRRGLKILWVKARVGSNPTRPTCLPQLPLCATHGAWVHSQPTVTDEPGRDPKESS